MNKEISCVMLIDDHHPTNVLNCLALEGCGLVKEIIIFDNGADALKYLNESFAEKHPKPDIIFLDINMPGMTGWEFINRYKNLPEEKKSETKLLMLSTSSHPEDLARAEDENIVKDYIVKPLTEEVIHNVVNKHFRKLKDSLVPVTIN